MFELRETLQFSQWLERLRDREARARIQVRLQRLRLGLFGDVKPVGDGVSELRIDYGPGYRVYYIRQGTELIVLLCGGDKRRQQQDIALAIDLARALK